ncbi:MAG: OB-fold nucleic acid binding domain-containing protein, partial [Clostridium sp.]
NGIDEKIANHIYDEMTDFAKYAFNKSHAAAYAVVSYRTAYLKYYYPVEFMAALMTSVKDNTGKVSEYILACRQMGMKIAPPDINAGEGGFSVSDGVIRYGLSAIKSIGQAVVDEIVKEREIRGPFVTLEDFVDRTSNKEVNKRTVESFIKSGALDGLPGTRKQKFLVSAQLIDEKAKEKKNSMEGQMSLFDFVGEEEKSDFQISFPNVGEYSKEELLAFEKEMLGVYVSGHPMEAYEECWRKNITAMSSDFTVDEETGEARVTDGQYVTIGGMITAKTVKTTRTNKMMAFVTIEDLTGQVEVLVFPKDYEKKREFLNPDEKVFIRGRVSIGEEPVGKMICEQVIPFSDVPRELWLQYPSREIYLAREEELLDTLRMHEGKDSVIIYLEAERAKKLLPMNWNVSANPELVQQLIEKLGERNVKVIEKPIEKIRRMH